jgi:hypothetical protein
VAFQNGGCEFEGEEVLVDWLTTMASVFFVEYANDLLNVSGPIGF